MAGMEKSARQAAEAREAEGRGKLRPKGEQRPADEGLFGRPTPPEDEIPFMRRGAAGGEASLRSALRSGDVKRGAQAMIDRLRMQAGLDEARNARNPDRARPPLERGEAREIEDFIDFIGHKMFDGVGLRILRGEEHGPLGKYDWPESLVTIFRNAISAGELTRTGVHELWHHLESALPPADRAAVHREFQRQQAKWLEKNEWARPFLRNGELHDFLANDAARAWIKRYGDEFGGKKARILEEMGRPVVGMIWGHDNYRFKNRSEYFAETMADRSFDYRDMQDAKARSVFAHVRDIYQRMVDGLKRLFGGDATGRIFEGFRKGEYEPARGVTGMLSGADAAEMRRDQRDPADDGAEGLASALKAETPADAKAAPVRLATKATREIKNLNAVERYSIFPRTLAALDAMSGQFWNAWKRRGVEAEAMLDRWRKTLPTFLSLTEAERKRVYGAEELDRIFQNRREDTGQPLDVYNTSTKGARHTEPGDRYTLSPKETKAYFERRAMFGDVWRSVMGATAKRMGWNGPVDVNAIIQAARDAPHPQLRAQYARTAELLYLMSQQERTGYVPFMRFGDYFVRVRPRAGVDTESLGGFPETKHFETVPSLTSWQEMRGKSLQPGQVPQAALDKIAELRKQFPESQYVIDHGHLFRRPDVLRSIDIPAVEKLMMLLESNAKRDIVRKVMERSDTPEGQARATADEAYQRLQGDLVDTFRRAMYDELRARFKNKARNVPGYSEDFDRATGAYMNWTARHAADLIHHDAIEQSFGEIQDTHPHQAVRQYWQKWRDYQDEPSNPLSRAAASSSQLGFAYALGMNPSSSFVFATHTPLATAPALSLGVGMPRAAATLGAALRHAYAQAGANAKRGLYIDLAKIGSTPQERALIDRLAREGALHSVSANDLQALNEQQASLWGKTRKVMQHGLELAVSNISVVDQANRAATALAFHRLAQDPATLERMAKAWSGNHVFRDMVAHDGLSPETMARFGLSEAAFEWGRANQSQVMRGPLGTLAFTLHGFQTRFLSAALKFAKNMGPSGRVALGYMMAGLWAGAGVEGLPFTQDLENAADKLWKALTGHDPMISYRIRAMLADAGFGKVGAEAIMRGPVSTLLGVNLSDRIGFGDILSRYVGGTDYLGTVPSMLLGRMRAAYRREQSGQGIGAAATEMLPSGLRHPAQAAIDAMSGHKSQHGKMVEPAAKISPLDTLRGVAGFQPLGRERAYAARDYHHRAQRAKGTVPHNPIPKPDEALLP
jgi:hypothetical protein